MPAARNAVRSDSLRLFYRVGGAVLSIGTWSVVHRPLHAPPMLAVCLGLATAGATFGVGWLRAAASGVCGGAPAAAWVVVTALVFGAISVVTFRGEARGRAIAARLVVCGAVIVALASTATLVVTGKCGDVFGTFTFWLDDDMMISLRYAANCARGDGLVWNVGEHVEGFTNLLWTLMLVPAHWLAGQDTVALVAIVMSTAFLIGAVVATFHCTRRLGASRTTAALAAMTVAGSAPLIHWTASGGEAPLAALLLVVFATLLLAGVASTARAVVVGIVAGLAVLTRPDCAVVVGVLLAWFTVVHRPRRSVLLAGGAAFVLLPALQVVLRLAYYGEVLPNTYYLKATGWDGQWSRGWTYVGGLVMAHAALVVAALGGIAGRNRRARLGIVCAIAAHLVYVASVGGDELPASRFLVPVIPLLAAVGFAGAERIGSALGPHYRLDFVLPGLLLVVGGVSTGLAPGFVTHESRERGVAELRNVQLGRLIEYNTKPNATVAHFWAGATAYFSNRRGIDLLGKCDRHVARLLARPGLNAPGHNKYDFVYSLGLGPDVVVGGLGGRADPHATTGLVERFRHSDCRAFVDLLDDPEFGLRYAAHSVGSAPDSPPLLRWLCREWHGTYVRGGTPRARAAMAWQLPPKKRL